MENLLDMGIYLTTAIKCPKAGLSVSTQTTKKCLKILEKGIKLFPMAKVYMLMGDVAIKHLIISQRLKPEKELSPTYLLIKSGRANTFIKARGYFRLMLLPGATF